MELFYREKKGQRIDKYLVEKEIKELYSRSHIDSLIADGLIKVNGKVVKKSHVLKPDDRIEISFPPPREIRVIPQKIPLDIVYEDEYLVVVNKTAGLTVHPAPGNETDTLVNALVHYLDGKIARGGHRLRPGIVHRLDKDTSGLVIAAKDDRTHSLMSRQFHNRSIDKYYKAVVVGTPAEQEGIIETFIDRSRTNRKKMAVSSGGREAVTRYIVETRYDYFSLVEIKLETGRTHQIRVHFSHLNCPVLGDNTYSSLKRTISQIPVEHHRKVKYLLAKHLKRQALHAWKLRFIHPVENRELTLEADYPDDFRYTLNWLQTNFS